MTSQSHLRAASAASPVASIPEYDAELPTDPDRLTRIGQAVAKMGRLELEVEDLERQLSEAKRKLNYYSEKVVPEMMAEAGTDRIRTTAGFDVEVVDVVHASFPKDPARQAPAFAYLTATGCDGLVKRQFTVSFGRDSTEWAEKFARVVAPKKEDVEAWEELRQRVVAHLSLDDNTLVMLERLWPTAVPRDARVSEHASVDYAETIHHQTLLKFVRDELRDGRPIPLEAFGAHVRATARIKR